MSDFLTRTAQLALGTGRRVEPLIAPRFAPAESLDMPRDDTSAAATEEAQPQPGIEEQVEVHPERTGRPLPSPVPVIKTPTGREQRAEITPLINDVSTTQPADIDADTPRDERVQEIDEGVHVDVDVDGDVGGGRFVRPERTLVRHPERVEGPGWKGGAEKDNELATPPPRSPDTLGMTAIAPTTTAPPTTSAPTTRRTREPHSEPGPGWEGGAEKDNELATPPPRSLDTLGMTAIAPTTTTAPSTTSAPTTRTTREQQLEPASEPEPPPPAPREQQQTSRERGHEREREQRPPAPPTEPFLRDAPRSATTASRRESASITNDEPPPVIVEIGRIEIINPAPSPPPAAPAPGLSPMSLDGYLSRRKGRA